MKLLHRRFRLFICLLLFFSTTKADHPSSQNSFEFLKTPFENATIVEDELALAESITGLPPLLAINTGILWALCKAPVFIYGMASKPQFTDIDKQELKSPKSNFCLQLAPLATVTETVLAGQVSPWPLNPLWGRPVFLSGAVLAAYSSIAYLQTQATPQNIATVILGYLAAEGFSRTISSGISTSILQKTGKTSIDDTGYHVGQNAVLAISTGLITASISYEMLLHKGVGSARACFISAISATVASALSQAISTHSVLHNTGFNIGDNVSFIAETSAVVGAIAGVMAGATFRVAALTNRARGPAVGIARLITLTGTIAGATVGVVTGLVPRTEPKAGVGAGAIAGLGVLAGAIAGAEAAIFSIIAVNELAPNNFPVKVAGAVTSATIFAFLNSLSGFATYGYPLEQSFSKTTQTLWNKFLAPFDYMTTLFPQLLSQQELEK